MVMQHTVNVPYECSIHSPRAIFNSKIAQLVEHSVVTRKVGGSLPSLGAIFNSFI